MSPNPVTGVGYDDDRQSVAAVIRIAKELVDGSGTAQDRGEEDGA